jgi:DNA adenine methylase
MTIRVAKVPGAKWRLVDWYIAHLPARRVYLEPYCGSAAVLFNKPRSPTEVVADVDGRVVALFRVLRDRPDALARAIRLTPWAREEWECCRRGRLDEEEAEEDLEKARRFLVESWQSHGLRSLSRSGWRHDGPSGRRGRSVAMEWADLPDRIEAAARRLQGVHIESRPALDVLARYDGPEVVAFVDPPYPAVTVHGKRDRLYRHEMLKPEQHRELLAALIGREGPVLACSYRNDIYDEMLLGAGWTVVETSTVAEHGNERIESLYLNAHAVAGRTQQIELLGTGVDPC